MIDPETSPAVQTVRTASGVAFAMLTPHAGPPAPTLLLLAMGGEDTLRTDPYRRVGVHLHAQGWNVLSLDLPCHGADRRPGEPAELAGWAARLRQGEDFVQAWRGRVNDVLAHVIKAGHAEPEQLAAAGTSRGGFMAFHAAAGNPLIRAVAAFAPVTDLSALKEFSGLEHDPLVRQLALGGRAEELAECASWIVIGNHDERVDTNRVVAFTRALVAAAVQRGRPPQVTLQVLPTPGHVSFPEWHDAAAIWLHAILNAHD